MNKVIKLRVPVFNAGKFQKFNLHELSSSGKSYSFGNCHFIGDYQTKDPELFTGMKDKNGKDIYNGDILKRSTNENGKVIFNELFSCYDFVCLNRELNIPLFNVRSDSEVIGNIHENPELLNG